MSSPHDEQTPAGPASLESLFAHAPCGFGVLDAGLRFVRVNAALAALAGQPAEALAGKVLGEVWPALPASVLAACEQARRDGRPRRDLTWAEESGLAGFQMSVFPAGNGEGGGLAVMLERDSGPDGSGEQARRLLPVTAALAQALTASEVKRIILQQAVRTTGAYGATLIKVFDAETLFMVGSVGYGREVEIKWQRFPAHGRFPVVDAIREKRAVFATREELGQLYPDLVPLLQPRSRAAAAIPLIAGGQVLAALTLSFGEEGSVAPAQQRFMLALAEHGAGALERARLYDAEHQARERASLFSEVGGLLASSLDVQETLERITALAVEHVADWCAVYQPGEEGRLETVAVAHEDPQKVTLLESFLERFPSDPDMRGTSAWVMRTGEEVLVPALPPELVDALPSREQRAAIKQLGFHSLILVPLTSRGRRIGVLGLATSHPSRTYGPADLDLARGLAQRAALALDNAELYEASRLSEQRYRSLVDATRQAVWTDTPDGLLSGEQPGWARLTGQTREQYAGMGWTEAVHPEDRGRSLTAWQRAVATQSSYEIEQRVRVADGSYRHFHVRAVPVFYGDGTVREWVGVHTDITEQVQARQELRASEERFRRVVEVSPTGIAIGALDGTLRFPNDAYLHMLGLTRADFGEGRVNWAELTPPEYREADERAFRQALQSGASEPYEKEMRRGDGTRFPVSLVLTRYAGEALVVAYVRDLTVQKAAERTLREYGEELERRVAGRTRALEEQRAALDAFVRFTELAATTSRVEELTRHAADVLQATVGPVSVAYYEPRGPVWQAVTWSADIPAEALAMIRAGVPREQPSFARAVQEGGAFYMEDWQAGEEGLDASSMYGAGALYPFYSDSSEGHSPGREPCGLLNMATRESRAWLARDRAIFRAVGRSFALALERSEQTRRLESQRAELDARTRVLEAFADLTRDLTQLSDPYLVIRTAQDILVSTLPGTTSVYYELEGETWRSRAQAGTLPPEVQALVDAGRPYSAGQNLVTAWEARRPLFVDAYDARTDTQGHLLKQIRAGAYLPLITGGKARGLLTVSLWAPGQGWSRTDRALLEALTHSLELALEGVTSTRTLQERTRELERSNVELERFAYVASHDLQEPLRTIASFTELVSRRYGASLDDRGRNYLGLVQGGAQRMKALIDDLLVFSRLNAVREPLRPVALERPMQEALERLDDLVGQTGARLHVSPLPTVLGDPGELIQVFQNLLGNALKFRREGTVPDIHITAAPGGEGWHLQVRDNGIGIEPQYHDRVFGMFQRLHLREQYEGTGLGLAIVKKIVERHGGRIWLESQPGAGTTFHLTLQDGGRSGEEPA